MSTDETDLQTINNAIRLKLSGDDGTVRRKCGCGGTGLDIGDYGPTGNKCSDCNGDGWIWNRERIAAAVPPNSYHQWLNYQPRGSVSVSNVWDNRDNQSWQSSLEEFVLGRECGKCRWFVDKGDGRRYLACVISGYCDRDWETDPLGW